MAEPQTLPGFGIDDVGLRSKFATAAELAGIFGMTTRRVEQLTRDGLPRNGRNRYPLAEGAAWMIRQLRSQKERERDPALCGARELAAIFGVSLSNVHQLRRRGMPRAGRGLYNIAAACRWFIQYKQTEKRGRKRRDQR